MLLTYPITDTRGKTIDLMGLLRIFEYSNKMLLDSINLLILALGCAFGELLINYDTKSTIFLIQVYRYIRNTVYMNYICFCLIKYFYTLLPNWPLIGQTCPYFCNFSRAPLSFSSHSRPSEAILDFGMRDT